MAEQELTHHEIRSDRLVATVVPALAMVCCSLRHDGDELLDPRSGLGAYAARGATMGIPLLHPWANRLEAPLPDSPILHRDGNGLAIHGVLPAVLPFRIVEAAAHRIAGEFSTDRDPALLAVFPHPHRLEVEIAVAGETLSVHTALIATGEQPVPVAFGYHPYLHPPGGGRDAWTIQAPVRTGLELDARMLPTGRRVPASIEPGPLAGRTFDDGFADVHDGDTFTVSDGDRTIAVELRQGYPFTQIYAPADAAVVCFEPMTAPANALASGDGLGHAAPGETVTASFAVTVSRR